MAYYLGIDGGGTKTIAAIANETGKIIFKAEGKTINFYSVGMKTAKENLTKLLRDIYSELGEVVFEGAFIGCSALDDEADEKTLQALCGGVIKAKKIKMNSDVYVALAASGEEACRAVAVCGTGSMAIGCDGEKIVVKGGWGHIIGDEGSAYSIAVNGLKACAILFDENKKSPLIDCACSFFGVVNFRKTIDKIYSHEITKDIISEFAVKVCECAVTDVIAKTIILNESHNFSRTVLSLLDELGCCLKLSLYGGVFKNNALFKECFINDIKEVYPSVSIEILALPAEEGALKVARSL